MYTDNVAFDDFTAKNIRALAVSGTDHLDAVVGMAYSTKSNTGVSGFFETLIAQNSVSTTEFGYYLGRANALEKSSLTLGGRDSTKHTDDFVSVPLVEQSW